MSLLGYVTVLIFGRSTSTQLKHKLAKTILSHRVVLSFSLPQIQCYTGADKSLARPGRKQTQKHVKDARDFNNIETRAVFFFPARQGAAGNSCHSDGNISSFPSRSG